MYRGWLLGQFLSSLHALAALYALLLEHFGLKAVHSIVKWLDFPTALITFFTSAELYIPSKFNLNFLWNEYSLFSVVLTNKTKIWGLVHR